MVLSAVFLVVSLSLDRFGFPLENIGPFIINLSINPVISWHAYIAVWICKGYRMATKNFKNVGVLKGSEKVEQRTGTDAWKP